ncbi:MAG: NUDIX hydrolase [Holosporales bacterium]|jgi:8-oxo-dGTP pyrophosphatase MutT (NUDIX family)|nr:NUDIX hydrolase [Holosporales bacterium]
MKICSSIITYYNDKFLFLKRRDPNYQFVPPCGKIEPHEHPIEGAVRELLEETCIKAIANKLLLVDVWTNDNLVSLTYITNSETEDVILSEEHEAYVWIESHNLQSFQNQTDYDLSKWIIFRELHKKYDSYSDVVIYE